MKILTPEELAKACGAGGESSLVAVDGKVYDVSGSKKWLGGLHMNRHRAGRDLSMHIETAPHGPEVLDKFEMVGGYRKPPERPAEGPRGRIDALLDRYPFFRKHPHPALVHFPEAMFPAAVIFEVIGLLSRSAATEWAAFCCLALGLVSLPPVLITGYFTWWINYDCTRSPILDKKRSLAWVVLALAVLGVVLRLKIEDPFRTQDYIVIAYLTTLPVLAVIATVVGFFGGMLTHPYK